MGSRGHYTRSDPPPPTVIRIACICFINGLSTSSFCVPNSVRSEPGTTLTGNVGALDGISIEVTSLALRLTWVSVGVIPGLSPAVKVSVGVISGLQSGGQGFRF